MKEDEAKKLLTEHVKALTLILGETPVKTDSSKATEALEAAREGQKALRKTLLDRVKDLPVVTQIQQLGTAGTVAISAAAVTQADLAKDATEVFVAEIANDIVEEVIEPPFFLDTFIDFHELNDWGQVVMAEKISEAQAFVSEASEPQQTSSPSAGSGDTKPGSDASSPGNGDDKPSQKQTTEQSQEQESEKSQTEENKSSKEEQSDKDQKESKQDKSSSDQEKDSSDKKQGEQKQSPSKSPEGQTEVKSNPSENNTVEKGSDVNKPSNFPLIETPLDSFSDDIKPHSSIRQVSPVN